MVRRKYLIYWGEFNSVYRPEITNLLFTSYRSTYPPLKYNQYIDINDINTNFDDIRNWNIFILAFELFKLSNTYTQLLQSNDKDILTDILPDIHKVLISDPFLYTKSIEIRQKNFIYLIPILQRNEIVPPIFRDIFTKFSVNESNYIITYNDINIIENNTLYYVKDIATTFNLEIRPNCLKNRFNP